MGGKLLKRLLPALAMTLSLLPGGAPAACLTKSKISSIETGWRNVAEIAAPKCGGNVPAPGRQPIRDGAA